MENIADMVKSDSERAGDFLVKEFKKGQDFFLLKLSDLLFET